jgi:hypothetical protein
MTSLSELLVEVAREDPLQLEANETPEEWASSMMLGRNPGGRIKKAVQAFLVQIQSAEGPAAETLRSQLRAWIA